MKTPNAVLVATILLAGAASTSAQPDNRFRQPHSRNQFEVLLYTSSDHWHNLSEPVAILHDTELDQLGNDFGPFRIAICNNQVVGILRPYRIYRSPGDA
jgi:hypothetical protein